MTISDIIDRLHSGETISMHEFHRMERRLAALRSQADQLDRAIRLCCGKGSHVRLLNLEKVDG